MDNYGVYQTLFIIHQLFRDYTCSLFIPIPGNLYMFIVLFLKRKILLLVASPLRMLFYIKDVACL